MTDAAAVAWCARLAGTLGDTAARVAALAVWIAGDWPDDQGQEWAERANLLGRELDHQAGVAAQLGADIAVDPAADAAAETAADRSGPEAAAVLGAAMAAARRRGAQLAGTDAVRVDPERGMRIARLDEDR